MANSFGCIFLKLLNWFSPFICSLPALGLPLVGLVILRGLWSFLWWLFELRCFGVLQLLALSFILACLVRVGALSSAFTMLVPNIFVAVSLSPLHCFSDVFSLRGEISPGLSYGVKYSTAQTLSSYFLKFCPNNGQHLQSVECAWLWWIYDHEDYDDNWPYSQVNHQGRLTPRQFCSNRRAIKINRWSTGNWICGIFHMPHVDVFAFTWKYTFTVYAALSLSWDAFSMNALSRLEPIWSRFILFSSRCFWLASLWPFHYKKRAYFQLCL